jgi:hypothetical protein
VLLSYRLPREPSTPRINLWRKLKRLGVAQLADGLVALPADARTREQLEWLAEDVIAAGGTAGIWIARPATVSQEKELAATLAEARAAEYRALAAEAAEADGLSDLERSRAADRLRTELHRITKRDYFPPVERDRVRAAIDALAGVAQAKPAGPENRRRR